MTDRPITFSAPMVRALLDGRKTQTRRRLHPQPAEWAEAVEIAPYKGYGRAGSLIQRTLDDHLQHGCGRIRFAVGDRLWVREIFMPRAPHLAISQVMKPLYRADAGSDRAEWRDLWALPVYMPRWASRLTLTVTDVRVERLQHISEEDARAEGLSRAPGGWWSYAEEQAGPDARSAYAMLWTHIHGHGAWDIDPWVAAITFTVEQRNIERAEPAR